MKLGLLPRLVVVVVVAFVAFGLLARVDDAGAQNTIGGELVAAPLELGGCSPAANQAAAEDARKLAPVVESGACLLLELVDDSGAVQKGCVVADDLVRLLETAAPPPPSRPTMVAAAIRVHVPRAPPRRHCAQWTYVDAGAVDAASSPKDASPE